MYDTIIQALQNTKRQYAAVLGAAGVAVVAAGIEFFLWQKQQDQEDRQDRHDMERKINALEQELAGLPIHTTSLITGAAVSYVPNETAIVFEQDLSPLDVALRAPVAIGAFTATSNLGTTPTLALLTSGATGELNQAGNFLLRLTAGSGSPAGGIQANFVPPSTIKGPVRVKLSPAPTANVIEGLKPYPVVNYGTDGVTVASISICTATAPSAATSYDVQVSIEPAPTSVNTGISALFSSAQIHAADATHTALLNVL